MCHVRRNHRSSYDTTDLVRGDDDTIFDIWFNLINRVYLRSSFALLTNRIKSRSLTQLKLNEEFYKNLLFVPCSYLLLLTLYNYNFKVSLIDP